MFDINLVRSEIKEALIKVENNLYKYKNLIQMHHTLKFAQNSKETWYTLKFHGKPRKSKTTIAKYKSILSSILFLLDNKKKSSIFENLTIILSLVFIAVLDENNSGGHRSYALIIL